MKKIRFVSLVLSAILFLGIFQTVTVQGANYSNVYNGVDYSAVFDYEYYYNRYPDLQRAFGKDYSALLRHFVTCGMSEGRQASEFFDVYYYKNRYYDLREAFGSDLRQYYIHYINCGKREGRVPCTYTVYNGIDYSDVFDYEYYYMQYPDLQKALGYNPFALLNHFVTSGMSEGRIAKEDFNVWYYRELYSDLRDAFGNDLSQYYIHYIRCGKGENRKAVSDSYYNGVDYSKVYDKNYYYNAYPDLRNAFGNDARALIRHFVVCGMNEGRQGSSSFSYSYYKNAYEDLRCAFGDDKKMYYKHFIDCGYSEGRSAVDSTTGWVTTDNGKMFYENGEKVTGWRLIDGRQYYFSDTGILKSKTGIDVSKHDGNIDWQQVKDDGIEFAIIRIGYGEDNVSQDDIKAVYNMNQCEALGIPYGVYIYSYALTEADVDSEIAHTLRMIEGRNPSMGVFFDMEDADGYKANHGMPSAQALNNLCIRYVQGITEAGYKAGVYASKNWFTNTLTSSKLDEYTKWVAQWAEVNTYDRKFSMWQYTSDGYVNGIEGRVDMDVYLER